jgi:60 kDa SS-A/Ro ribonucleoprotein
MRETSKHAFGETDCSLPMIDALSRKIEVDLFIVITDNETYAGERHPCQALEKYNKEMKRQAKLVVIATAVNDFSIAEPNNPNMLDIVGYSDDMLAVINHFVGE